MTEQKQRFREELREQERRLTKAALSASNQRLAQRFLALEEVAAANTVLLYCSMGTEPDTEAVLEELLARGKRVAQPRCLPGRSMETRLYVPGCPCSATGTGCWSRERTTPGGDSTD